MSGNRRPPRARDRVLGAQLRAIRTQHTAMTLDQVAAAAKMSPATLSRVENGRKQITSVDAAILLSVYRAPKPLREKLIELAREGGQDGIWRFADSADHGGVAQLESTAHRLTEWTASDIPPLLQTAAYAAERLRAAGATAHGIDLHLRRLLDRQAALRSLRYTAFVHESAVLAPAERRPALREQIARLVEAIDRGISVRVLRGPLALHPVSPYPWSFLEFPNDPPIVRLRLQTLDVYLDKPESVAYEQLRAGLDAAAYSALDSRRLLGTLTRRAC
jgi:transcriptional regulator with XRE-family HTH domain